MMAMKSSETAMMACHREILVGDHSGSFSEYKEPLATFAPHYASVVNSGTQSFRTDRFCEAYLASFRLQFLHIQGDYRKRRRAFDTLFKHCRYDTGGSFAYRWECTLRRLEETDADSLLKAIRKNIRALKPELTLYSPGATLARPRLIIVAASIPRAKAIPRGRIRMAADRLVRGQGASHGIFL